MTTDNVFHIVLFKYFLDEDGLYEIDETLKKFRDFIQQEKPQYRPNLRRWNTFFDVECGVIPNYKKDSITMSVFIGFERVQSRNILSIASERMITIIEPNTFLLRTTL
jgi:hypothetical protein